MYMAIVIGGVIFCLAFVGLCIILAEMNAPEKRERDD